jgi:hypothetical protein
MLVTWTPGRQNLNDKRQQVFIKFLLTYRRKTPGYGIGCKRRKGL